MNNDKKLTLTIATTDKRFSIKLPEAECIARFDELVSAMLASPIETSAIVLKPVPEPPAPIPQAPSEPEDLGVDEVHIRPDETVTTAERKGYRGFLYVKCVHCGNEWGLNAREERTSVHCNNCGKDTELSDVVRAYVNCECGGRFTYLTNSTEACFDINCLKCRAPVPLMYNKAKRCYETIR